MGSNEHPEPCKCRKDSEVLSREMYLAAKHGDLKKIRQYLMRGHSVNACDEDGCSLLASACIAGCLEVVRFLHRIPELHRNIGDWTGDTPLMHAARMGNKEVVKELLTCPHPCYLDINVRNSYQDTALCIATASNHADISKLIQEAKLPRLQWHPKLMNSLRALKSPASDVTFECNICLEEYNTKERRPRSLSCGHTLCTSCITSLINDRHLGGLECAICRRPHAGQARAASDIPVNFAIDEIFQKRQQ